MKNAVPIIVACLATSTIVLTACSEEKPKPSSVSVAPPPPTVPVDNVEAQLRKARKAYESSMDFAVITMRHSIETRMKSIADTGDLDAVKALIARRDAFERDRTLPPEPELKAAVERYRRDTKATHDLLAAALDDGIRQYTKKLAIEKAEAVRQERESLIAALPMVPASQPAKPELKGALNELLKDVVLLYTFDEDSLFEKDGRKYARDLSPRGNDAIIIGASVIDGMSGKAVHLDRARVRVESINEVGLTGDRPRTLAFWLKEEVPVEVQYAILAFGGNADYGQFGVELKATHFSVWFYGTDWVTPVPRDHKWHHHTITYDGEMLRWYVDGQDCGGSRRVALKTLTGPLTFEASPMTVDELVVIDRALTAEEATKLFELSKQGLAPKAD